MDPELVVKFKGDLTEWSAAIAKAKADMSSLSVGMNGTITTQNRFGKSAVNSTQSTNQLIASLNSLGNKMKEAATQTAANTSAVKNNSDALKSNSDALKATKNNNEQASTGLGTLTKGYLTLGAALAAGRMFLDSTKEVQKFENQLKVASGTQEQYGKNTQFLEGLAAKYNKNVLDLGANFAQLTIATKGTNLEGAKTERLFAAVTATSSALQMSVDDTNGTFRAFIQMVSKGNVQAEELRGQLGERLYGAFNLAAKAMGVNTQELNKMLQSGEVLAADLLPKLTTELEKTFGADAEKNAKNLGSAIEYSTGQISLLVAELGKSSGTTSFLSNMATDAGTLLNQLRLINKEKGVTGVVLGLMDSGAETLFNGTGFEGPTLKRARELQKSVNWQGSNSSKITGQGNVVGSLTGEYRDTAFGLPSSIRADPGDTSAADEKTKKEAEKAARKAETEMNKWVAEQIQLSNDRLKAALADSASQLDAKYRNQNGVLGPIGMAKPTGTDLNYDYGSDKFNKEFSKQTTGDGSAVNFDKTTAQIEGMTKAWWDEKNAKDASAKATSELGASMEELSKELNTIVQESSVNLFSGIAESIGELSVSTDGIENVGAKIAGIFGDMISQVGKAIIAYGLTMKGLQSALKASFKNPYVAIAVGAVAIAAGAALKASTTKKNNNAQNNFFTGGIVKGPHGVDNIPINVSNNEMVLNGSQQGRLFGMLDGAYSGGNLQSSSSRGNRYSATETGTLEAKIRGEDLTILVERGKRRMNRYN